MPFGPLNLNLGKSSTVTTNGTLTSGYHIGFNLPKGPYIHSFNNNFYLSKDGIYQSLQQCYKEGNFGYFFIARGLALLEAIMYLICFPFMVVAYLIIALISLIMALPLTLLLPFNFEFCCCNTFMSIAIPTNRAACGVFWLIFAESLLSILYGLIYCITSPFQIVVPEFTQLLLQQHRWGTGTFNYF
jgi:hypothetical protein